MTDGEIEEQIAAHLAAAEALRKLKRARDGAASDGVLITAKEATAICGRSESQVRRDCENHPTDAGGFGVKRGGRWFVDKFRYREMRGNARMRV
jgi:hypothetical protein